MTKELLDLLDKLNIQNYSLYSAIYDELTINNVVIPKGENRHPYADVLHEWIEGVDIVASEDRKHNHDVSSAKSKLSGSYYLKKCIKPSKPIYEYLWILPSDIEPQASWATIESMTNDYPMCPWIRTETKRVRQ